MPKTPTSIVVVKRESYVKGGKANAHCFSELIQSVGLKHVRYGHLELG